MNYPDQSRRIWPWDKKSHLFYEFSIFFRCKKSFAGGGRYFSYGQLKNYSSDISPMYTFLSFQPLASGKNNMCIGLK